MHLHSHILLAEDRTDRLHEEIARDRLVALARAARAARAGDPVSGSDVRSTAWPHLPRTRSFLPWDALRRIAARLATG